MQNVKIPVDNILCKLSFERPADRVALAESKQALVSVNFVGVFVVLCVWIFWCNDCCFAQLFVNYIGIAFSHRAYTVNGRRKRLRSDCDFQFFAHENISLCKKYV